MRSPVRCDMLDHDDRRPRRSGTRSAGHDLNRLAWVGDSRGKISPARTSPMTRRVAGQIRGTDGESIASGPMEGRIIAIGVDGFRENASRAIEHRRFRSAVRPAALHAKRIREPVRKSVSLIRDYDFKLQCTCGSRWRARSPRPLQRSPRAIPHRAGRLPSAPASASEIAAG